MWLSKRRLFHFCAVWLSVPSLVFCPAAAGTAAAAAAGGQRTFSSHRLRGGGGSSSSSIPITAASVVRNLQNNPNPPTARDDNAETPFNTRVLISVLVNDNDEDGDPISVVSNTDPSNGSAVINTQSPFENTITYTPNQGFIGVDSFLYTISDGKGRLGEARVTVNVLPPPNRPPDARDDVGITTPVNMAVVISVLDNDRDRDGDVLTITAVTPPSHGTASINDAAAGTITYTPNTDFVGTDTFSYTISDGKEGGTNTAIVELQMVADAASSSPPPPAPTTLPPPSPITTTPPIATLPPPPSVPTNKPPFAVYDTATTAQNTPVTIDVLRNDLDGDDGDVLTVISVTDSANNGNVVINPEGAAAAGTTVTYTPAQDFVGTDTFQYTVSDDKGGTATGTVIVEVTPVLSPPPVTTTTPGTAAPPPPPPTTTLPLPSTPAPPTTPPPPPPITTAPPVANNSPPVAADDTATTAQNTPVTIDVLRNDLDVDGGDVLTITSVTDSANNGNVLINPDGAVGGATITYTPPTDFVGTDTFQYTVSDSKGATTMATVTVEVTPVLGLPQQQECLPAFAQCHSDTAKCFSELGSFDIGGWYNVLVRDGPFACDLMVNMQNDCSGGNVVGTVTGTASYNATTLNAQYSFVYNMTDSWKIESAHVNADIFKPAPLQASGEYDVNPDSYTKSRQFDPMEQAAEGSIRVRCPEDKGYVNTIFYANVCRMTLA